MSASSASMHSTGRGTLPPPARKISITPLGPPPPAGENRKANNATTASPAPNLTFCDCTLSTPLKCNPARTRLFPPSSHLRRFTTAAKRRFLGCQPKSLSLPTASWSRADRTSKSSASAAANFNPLIPTPVLRPPRPWIVAPQADRSRDPSDRPGSRLSPLLPRARQAPGLHLPAGRSPLPERPLASLRLAPLR